MTAPGRIGGADPIEDYVAALAAVLHGPARAKARMIAEMRDGLADAAAAHGEAGLPDDAAAREAVREFGSPGEVAPSCQRELTIAQARHTAGVVALTVAGLLACWYLARAAGPATGAALPRPGQVLVVHLAGVATVAALLAAAALAATGTLARLLPTPPRLPLAVAWTGTTAAVAMALAGVAFAVAALLTAHWPLLALVGALVIGAHAAVAASARACRHCARLSIASSPPPGTGGPTLRA